MKALQLQSFWDIGERVLAHAAVGCGSAMLSAGNCGRGALSAGLSELANQVGLIEPPAKSLASWGAFRGAAEAGLIGGVTSKITGGKFDDGFSVAAAGYLFNSIVHKLGQIAVYYRVSGFISAVVNDPDYSAEQKLYLLSSAVQQDVAIQDSLGYLDSPSKQTIWLSLQSDVQALQQASGPLLNEVTSEDARIVYHDLIFGAAGGLAGAVSEVAGAAIDIGGTAYTWREFAGLSTTFKTAVAVSPMGSYNHYYVYSTPNH